MAEQDAILNMVGALSRANSASNGLITPETGRFLREILKKAVTNPAGVDDPWGAEACALLANVLVNDYLHGWNNAGQAELDEAKEAAGQALALNSELALAHHACGLIRRAEGNHEAAFAAFEKAVKFDRGFARALAQKGNELTLLGKPKEALSCVDQAIKLSPNDPTAGIFYWVKGRAHFFAGQYKKAVPWLDKSVRFQPTVWYNWLYLVSAYACAGRGRGRIEDQKKARKILAKFKEYPQFAKLTLQDIRDYEKANPNENEIVVKAREHFYRGLEIAGMR